MAWRTSVIDTVIRTSASSAEVPGFPITVSRRTNPLALAAVPFASGVPTVTYGDDCDGGLHEGNASAGPCVRFGEAHALKTGTRGTRVGVAPFDRTYPALSAPL